MQSRILGRLEATWIAPYSASRDGRWLVGALYDPKSQSDIWVLDLAADDPEHAARSIAAPGEQVGPALSPDGRWLAYCADDTGKFEIFLQRFPGGESKVRVSSGGGDMARWSPDGRGVYFLSGDGTSVMAVGVRTEPKLELGAPLKLLDGSFRTESGTGPSFEPSADGQRFALIKQLKNPNRSVELIVVQNWFSEIRRLFQSGSR